MKQQTLDQRLKSYGVVTERKDTPSCKLFFAASAVVGVGAVIIPPPAEAAIVYSGVQNKVVNGSKSPQVNFDKDGNAEFTFLRFSSNNFFTQKLAVSTGGTGQVIKSNQKPARLAGNYTVSSLKVFGGVASEDLASTYNNGNFSDQLPGFLGVKFKIAAETHYGWIQYKANSDASVGTVIDWAYEDIPGKAIKTGEKKSFNWNLFLPAIINGHN